MPGDGIRAATEISEALPDCAVVMLTVSRNDSDLFYSLRAGAAGYLLKDTDPSRLPDALRRRDRRRGGRSAHAGGPPDP